MGPKVFGGIEFTIEEIQGIGGGHSNTHLWWFDLPFTIALDFVTLPVAVIAEITGWARNK